MMKHHSKHRRGMSLMEVTIASLLAGLLAAMSAGIAVDITRNVADNIQHAQIAQEARLALESFRRDFAGSSHDIKTGDRVTWRLVGRLIPSASELRLCYDADRDASADWVLPDHVVIYRIDNGQLVRDNLTDSTTYLVARHVDDVTFEADGNEITIEIDFAYGGAAESYSFATSDIP